ncbi:hypothetical protein PUN28_016545 [Cardiocondyla obscurior]|uniref:Uncharacterized protein n=1 Tax=Cardiocondyla obscurior TaxID=286306 RepID=A0AAW2ET14_9HYME
MNFAALGFILIGCHAWAIETDDNIPTVYDAKDRVVQTFHYKTKLEKFLDKLKSKLQKGDSDLGIPILDPYIANKLQIELRNETSMIDFEAGLTNITIVGLSAYKVNSADLKLIGLKAQADLIWSNIKANTNYSMNGHFSILNVYGNGSINAVLKDLRVRADINLALKDIQHVRVEKVLTTVTIGEFEFNATGLYNDKKISQLLSQTISKLIPQALDLNEIANHLNDIVTQVLNKFLATKTIFQLIRILDLL